MDQHQDSEKFGVLLEALLIQSSSTSIQTFFHLSRDPVPG